MPTQMKTNMRTVPVSELPSSRTLLRSTAIAAAVAALLLVTVVLPAEYGVDPTGVGRVLGLTEMGEIKMSLAQEVAADAAADANMAAAGVVAAAPAAVAPAPATQTVPSAPGQVATVDSSFHITEVTLQPDEGKEIKLVMREGARVNYAWSTDRGVVNYDTHADRTALPAISYHGYAKGSGVPADSGVLVAAFDGSHGWFWRNRTREVVTVTLRTSGDYQELKRME